MCLIGEAFGEQGLIVNGAVVNIRLVDRDFTGLNPIPTKGRISPYKIDYI